MLKIDDITIAYKSVTVIDHISFEVRPKQLTVLIGANGVGKTTIMKAIMGVHKPVSGHIWYNGDTDLCKVRPYRMTGLGISICPEGRQLFPDMTVLENMEMGAYVRRDKEGVRRDLKDLLERFPILNKRKNQKASTLSGGEQEILAIARALIINPKLLLLDEPSWGLAPLMIEEVMQTIDKIKQESDTTILLVEQNANIALKHADYAYLLDDSGIAMEGTGKQLLSDKKVQEVYLGA